MRLGMSGSSRKRRKARPAGAYASTLPRNHEPRDREMAEIPRLNGAIRALEAGKPAFVTFSPAEIGAAQAIGAAAYDGNRDDRLTASGASCVLTTGLAKHRFPPTAASREALRTRSFISRGSGLVADEEF